MRMITYKLKHLKKQNHQRLKAGQQDFAQWLLGFTEGNGCFFIDKQSTAKGFKKWNLGFKIAIIKKNIRALIYIKKYLNIGTIKEAGGSMVQYRIRNRKNLARVIFPIFDSYPMMTQKYFDYLRVRKTYDILENKELSYTQRNKQVEQILCTIEDQKTKTKQIAPVWYTHLGTARVFELVQQPQPWKGLAFGEVSALLQDAWLRGFFESEGSFYLVKKDEKRICPGFGLTQKNRQILEAIRVRLHIVAQVRYRCLKNGKSFYALDTTNLRSLEKIRKLCSGKLVSMKSLEFRLWEKSLGWDPTYKRLFKLREKMRRLRTG